MRKIIKYICFALVIFISSCNDSDLYDGLDFMNEDGTKSEKFAGTWYVKFNDFHNDTWCLVKTYNTTENEKNVFWVKFYGVKVDGTREKPFMLKTSGKDDLTFVSQENQEVHGSSDNASITGKIENNSYTTANGNVTDKLTITVVYDSEPDKTYTLVGYKRTGWEEDDMAY